MTLWILLSAHFVADFTLQTDTLVRKKTQKFRYLLLHAGIYAVVLAMAIFACVSANAGWVPFLIIVVSHFLIDWIRGAIDKTSKTSRSLFVSFLADQAFHIIIICVLVGILDLNALNTTWVTDLASRIPLEQILRYALIFIIILDPASVFVKKLSICVSGHSDRQEDNNEVPAGSIIGKLERLIIAILVLCNEIGAIGFVLTAKSIARYKQLNEQGFAEKYLVGTLSSTAIAIIAALLLR